MTEPEQALPMTDLRRLRDAYYASRDAEYAAAGARADYRACAVEVDEVAVYAFMGAVRDALDAADAAHDAVFDQATDDALDAAFQVARATTSAANAALHAALRAATDGEKDAAFSTEGEDA